jgi:hypothetical protein
MSTSYGSTIPGVLDGLVLYLDAAKRKSYTSGETTWRDLRGNGIDGTLINGPIHTGFNKAGSFLFDGVNESVDNVGTVSSFKFIHGTRIFSISIWIKFTNINKRQFFMGNTLSGFQQGVFLGLEYIPDNQYYGVNALRIQTTIGTAGNVIGNVNVTGDNAITDTNWHHVVYTSDATDNFGKFYVDGVLQSRKTPDPFFVSLGNTTPLDAVRTMSIGRANHSSLTLPMDGSVGLVKVYKKGLNAVEVFQDYNATKGRFGL